MKSTIPYFKGISSDMRTGRWGITCPKCRCIFEPKTTMLSTQELTCPNRKCGAEMIARYNDETVNIVEAA